MLNWGVSSFVSNYVLNYDDDYVQCYKKYNYSAMSIKKNT